MSPETRRRCVTVGVFALFAAATVGTGTHLARDLPIPSDATPRDAYVAGVTSAGGGSHGDGYSRDAFGDGWGDLDRDGCDTRQEVLAAWLADEVLAADRCTVLSGALVDPYTGATVPFRRGGSNAFGGRAPQPVQVDHVVPLHGAWHAGADGWTAARREAFANDLSNLLPTTLNSTKGDDGPARLLDRRQAGTSRWRPSLAGECRYAQAYVLVTAEHRLDVADADAAALATMLAPCP